MTNQRNGFLSFDVEENSHKKSQYHNVLDQLILESFIQIDEKENYQRTYRNSNDVIDQPYASLFEYVRLRPKVVTDKVVPKKFHWSNIIRLAL